MSIFQLTDHWKYVCLKNSQMTETYSGKIRHKQPCYFELGLWGFLYVGLFSGQVDLTRPKKKNFQNISSFALWSLVNFHCDTICLFQKRASVALALWSANKSLNSGQFPPFQSKRCWCCRQPLGHLHSTLSWCLFWWYSNLNSSVSPCFVTKDFTVILEKFEVLPVIL